MYRPQFVFPVSIDPCRDMRCQYSFDWTNLPALAAGIVPATWNWSLKIPMVLDQDADFFIRGIVVSPTALEIGIVDAYNNSLVDPGQGPGYDGQGLPPTMVSYVWAQTMGAGLIAEDGDNWGIYCPAGAARGLYIGNFTPLGTDEPVPVINIHGVKRFQKGACR